MRKNRTVIYLALDVIAILIGIILLDDIDYKYMIFYTIFLILDIILSCVLTHRGVNTLPSFFEFISYFLLSSSRLFIIILFFLGFSGIDTSIYGAMDRNKLSIKIIVNHSILCLLDFIRLLYICILYFYKICSSNSNNGDIYVRQEDKDVYVNIRPARVIV